MKRNLLLIPVILATTAAIADTQATGPSSRADAQAQAAALLGHPYPSGGIKADEVGSPSHASVTADAQAQAAALLSGIRPGTHVSAPSRSLEPSDSPPADAQAQAAALLSGSRGSTQSQVRTDRVPGGARATGKSL